MTSPGNDRSTSGAGLPPRTRKRKACQRCRLRKQKCDAQEPSCKNCTSSGSDCIPATTDAVEIYPVSYVKSLEQHVAELENRLNQQNTNPTPAPALDPGQQSSNLLMDILQPADPMHWQYSFYSPIINASGVQHPLDTSLFDSNDFNSFPVHAQAESNATKETPTSTQNQESFGLEPAIGSAHNGDPLVQRISIPQKDAATFIQSFFDRIYSRYPFLDVDEVSNAYLHWKGMLNATDDLQAGWFSFLMTLIFAIGSVMEQSGGNRKNGEQHEMLIARVQAERGVISNPSASPLVRLKAMLLHVIFAMHGENTSRLVHLSGVTMRFATLHGFHRLQSKETDEEALQKTRAWSCIYALDRMVSGTLRIPVCISDSFITTPLYQNRTPYLCTMSWLLDYPGYGDMTQVINLSTFTHMLRVRQIQSKIMCAAPTLKADEIDHFTVVIQAEIDEWSKDGQLVAHSQPENEGYLSPLWLQYMACIGEVVLYSSFGEVDYKMPRASKLLKACCDTCNAFRTVQKRRQLARSWIDMVFEFQAGVTILYLTWRGSAANFKDADRAVRDCTSSLAILAEGAPNVEHFRDCFDALATFVVRKRYPDTRRVDGQEELKNYSRKVIELGIAPNIADMLMEMSEDYG